jgi:hypothetical protein
VLSGAQDLRVVVNHELGHLIGLSHSLQPSSLMHAEYEGPSALPSRDDARGVCELLPLSSAEADATAACTAAPIEGEGRCVGTGGCLVFLPPTPAPECSFQAPVPRRTGGLGPWPAWAMGVLSGLALLRRRQRPCRLAR